MSKRYRSYTSGNRGRTRTRSRSATAPTPARSTTSRRSRSLGAALGRAAMSISPMGRSISRGVSMARSLSRASGGSRQSSQTAVTDHRGTDESIHGKIGRAYTQIGKTHKTGTKGSWKFFDEFYYTIKSSEGKQGVSLMAQVCSYQDILKSPTFGPLENPAQKLFATRQVMFDLNPYQFVSGSNYYTAGVVPSQDRIHIDKVKLHFSMANFMQTKCLLDVYLLEHKRDGNKTPVDAWNEGLVAQRLAPDSADAANSFSSATVLQPPTEGGLNVNFLGVRPYESPAFMKEFKVLKYKTFEFAADTDVKWDVDINVNKTVDKQMMKSTNVNTDTYFGYHGLTYSLMAVTRGSVISDSQTNTGKFPSISDSEIGVCVMREYHCSVVSANKRIQTATALPYLLTGAAGGAGNETIVNVVDAVTAVAEQLEP